MAHPNNNHLFPQMNQQGHPPISVPPMMYPRSNHPMGMMNPMATHLPGHHHPMHHIPRIPNQGPMFNNMYPMPPHIPHIQPKVAPKITLPEVKPPEKQTVYVGKIATSVSDEFLQTLLQKCGTVVSWRRVTDPVTHQKKGFGFCEYEGAEGALRALRLLNSLGIGGQELLIKVDEKTQKILDSYVEKNGSTGEKDDKTILDEIQELLKQFESTEEETKENLPDEETNSKHSEDYQQQKEKERLRRERDQKKIKLQDSRKRERERELRRKERDEKEFFERERQLEFFERQLEKDRERRERDKEREKQILKERTLLDYDSDERSRKMRSRDREKRKREREREREDDEIDRHLEEESIRRAEQQLQMELQRKEQEEKRQKKNNEDENEQKQSLDHSYYTYREEVPVNKPTQTLSPNESKTSEIKVNSEREIVKTSPQIITTSFSTKSLGFGLNPGKKNRVLGQVASGFEPEEEEDPLTVRKPRPLIRLEPFSSPTKSSENSSLSSTSSATESKVNVEEVKSVIDRIPTDKEKLFSYPIDWEFVDQSGMATKKLSSWVSKKIVGYLGEEEKTLVEFILQQVIEHIQPFELVEKLKSVLDEETESFVINLWRFIIFEILRSSPNST